MNATDGHVCRDVADLMYTEEAGIVLTLTGREDRCTGVSLGRKRQARSVLLSTDRSGAWFGAKRRARMTQADLKRKAVPQGARRRRFK